MIARAIAWIALLAVATAVVLGAYLATSSSLAFFNEKASEVASQLDSAPQLRSVVEQALRFCSSFTWMTFALLVVALFVSLATLWLKDLASR